jgi:uncharacterized protein YccT (UPF0319 family)
MNETPMKRLPQNKIWQMIESMLEDYNSTHESMMNARRDWYATHDEETRDRFLLWATKARTLLEEILRWELL